MQNREEGRETQNEDNRGHTSVERKKEIGLERESAKNVLELEAPPHSTLGELSHLQHKRSKNLITSTQISQFSSLNGSLKENCDTEKHSYCLKNSISRLQFETQNSISQKWVFWPFGHSKT